MGYLSCKTRSSIQTSDSLSKPPQQPPQQPQIFAFHELEAATHGFSVHSLLGKGSHGCVYKGTLLNGTPVAVKRPSRGLRLMQDEAAFDNEIQILSNIDHPRLVKLLGFCHDPPEKLLVVEFMPNGTLYDTVHRRPEPLGWPMRVHLALQIAKAISALHLISPPIIHRDVKSSNVLIDRDWNAKLGDFGLALRVQDGLTTPPAGTLGYLDPEYTTPEMLSPKNDVFSFGILLLEIISGRHAIDVHYNPPGILDWALPLIKAGKALALCDPKLRPPRSKSALSQMAMIASRCVRSRSARRPTMGDVVEHLQEISKKIPLSVFNGISHRMKRSTIISAKPQYVMRSVSTPHLYKNSPRRGCPRSPKVYDESPGVLKNQAREGNLNEEVTFPEACDLADLRSCRKFVLREGIASESRAERPPDSQSGGKALLELLTEPN